MQTQRATALAWAGVVLLGVSGAAFWSEWKRTALPRIDSLANPAPSSLAVEGWDLSHEHLLALSTDTLVHPVDVLTSFGGGSPMVLVAKPVSPIAKLRYWLGAYPEPWGQPFPR